MNEKLTPFVKWAGGKKQLLPQLIARMPEYSGTYYEPFIGGGAMLLALQPQRAVMNDVNAQLLNIYIQLKQNAENVIAEVEKLDTVVCNREYYLSVRKQYNQKISDNILDPECAALMIWLNKHCFNGLYRVNSKGLFNVPYNNKTKGPSIDAHNLRRMGQYLNDADVEIRHGDFEAACHDVKAGDFVYFDSPYIPVSATSNFTDYTKNGFSFDEHRRLADLFRHLDEKYVHLMLSNHDVPLIYEWYEGFHIEAIRVRRAINRDGTKRMGKEVIVTNNH
ncbi:MAG: DNA adenine methylase [Proteobacteria bacterium]|nr:DNA adenine methylase [Pseudomonadota bacterium]